jgi:enediyne biosynthesis protein E4
MGIPISVQGAFSEGLLTRRIALFFLFGLMAVAGCRHPAAAPPAPMPVQFTDVTAAAGVRFAHNNGAAGARWLPETMGSGCAVIDYDRDGDPDLFLVNSRDWTPDERRRGMAAAPGRPPRRSTSALYRNRGDGTFEDVTERAGLAVETFGQGVCVGDVDNDGFEDLYLTALGRNYLFRNNGNGTFTEVARQAGVQDRGWSTSAAFVDYDRDGHLDLFVCHYVQWTPETDIYQSLDGQHKSYGRPEPYPGESSKLYHNNGSGRFTDVTARAGLARDAQGRVLQGKSLGVALCDYDNDGWIDLAVANDTEPNYLFHNRRDGTFSEEGISTGIALSETGEARGAMGIDASDYDHTGRDSLIIGNFSNQMLALYHNSGSGLFVDKGPATEVGRASLLFLAFGCFFFDMDNDGWPDIFTANGHVDDDINRVQKDLEYAQRPLLFRNLGGGQFQEVGRLAGPPLRRAIVGRGAVHLDLDLDGDSDLLMTTNGGPAYLLRNEGGNRNPSVRLRLVGTKSNRSAIGARVVAQAGAVTLRRLVQSGTSYCSQPDTAITLGLAGQPEASRIEIAWPSGGTTRLEHVKAGRMVTICEGVGIIAAAPFRERTPSGP